MIDFIKEVFQEKALTFCALERAFGEKKAFLKVIETKNKKCDSDGANEEKSDNNSFARGNKDGEHFTQDTLENKTFKNAAFVEDNLENSEGKEKVFAPTASASNLEDGTLFASKILEVGTLKDKTLEGKSPDSKVFDDDTLGSKGSVSKVFDDSEENKTSDKAADKTFNDIAYNKGTLGNKSSNSNVFDAGTLESESKETVFAREKAEGESADNVFKVQNNGECFVIKKAIKKNLTATLTVEKGGKTNLEVTDGATKEAYTLCFFEGARGGFAQEVAQSLRAFLKEVSKAIFGDTVYQNEKTLALLAYAKNTWAEVPDFPWKDLAKYCVLREKTKGKWYALFMVLKKSTVYKSKDESDKMIEVVNFHGDAEDVATLLSENHEGFLSAYHMNKKYWYTVDLSVAKNELLLKKCLEKSRESVFKKKTGKREKS